MRTPLGRILAAVVSIAALQLLASCAYAVDTMADWVGENTNAANKTFTTVTTVNDYGLLSATSIGGQVQSKINFAPEGFTNNNEPHIYFADQSLDGTFDFTSTLHMDGTITFSAPVATEPNFFFGWYSSEHTGHRIGLGVSNSVETGFVAEDNFLRVDLGYGSTPSKFYWTSGDGTLNQANHNSVLPNGTYPFTFDYQPGPDENPGGTMSATVGDYHFSISPLDSQPWITDFFSLDRFGILQRTTGQTSNNPVGPWNVTFSNVTYTGGTPVAGGAIGDFDGNGQVDAADLTILTGNYGNAGTSATGDADGNLVVDGNDFLIWQRNAVTGGAASAVPEPGALALLAIGGLAGLLRRRSV